MKYITFLCITILLTLLAPAVRATGEFRADYDVQYNVSPAGITVVTQNIVLTNNLTNLYPQEYAVTIDTEKIRNVISYDGKGAIQPSINQQDGKTQILLRFNESSAGLGKRLNFTLRYENHEVAQKNGTIWEINIPGIVASPDMGDYYVNLQVPPSFGANAYMSPKPATGGRWNKEQMIKGGISAAYGTEQIFKANLKYYLENTSFAPQERELVIPSDSPTQRVVIESIDPKPKKVLRDRDGNWLALYSLLPGQRLEVTAGLLIATYLFPRDNYPTESSDMSVYLRPTKYWQSDDARIIELSKQYTTAKEIYDYVVGTLTYDYKRVTEGVKRKGALASLADPDSSLCMDYTDLFIAIARAAGIPARENIGYAYTTNAKLRPVSLISDVLHAWPEYYDKESAKWTAVDPTWQRTTGGINYFDKLDFNHIIFAKHGIHDEYPYPAGFYKKSGINSKDVLVSFGDRVPSFGTPDLSVQFRFPKVLTAGISSTGAVIITNDGGTAAENSIVSVKSSHGNKERSYTIDHVPPFAEFQIPVTLKPANYFAKENGELTVTVDGKITRYSYSIHPLYWAIVLIIAITAVAVTGFWMLLARIRLWITFRNR